MFRILIIEDEELYRKFLIKILQKKYRCDTAGSADEAKALFSKNTYDIVLYDLRLPGVSGKELVQWVRREVDPDVVNIVITGYEDDWTPVQATEENIFYYLRKGDFQPNELLKIMGNASAVRKLRVDEKKSFSNRLASEGIAHAGKLAASIAHEINNPLQSLYLLIDTLKHKINTADSAALMCRDLALMERGVERIGSIVKQLLHLYRIDRDQTGPEEASVVFQRALSFLRPIAKEQSTQIILAPAVGAKEARVSPNPLFYTLVNLCMKLLNDRCSTIKIEYRIDHRSQTLNVTISAVMKDSSEGEAMLPEGLLGSLGGTISVQRKGKGPDHRILLRLPLVKSVSGTSRAAQRQSIRT
jgi:CheY-like chemotaxis protein